MPRAPRTSPITCLTLLLAGLAMGGCRGDATPTPRAATVRPVHLVETATVRVEALGYAGTYTGTLRARRTLRVFAREEGRIVALPYYEGDAVRKGDLLLRLDDDLLRAELDKAVATRRQAELDVRRLERLIRQKLVSEDEVAQARTAVEVARAEEAVLSTRLAHTVEHAPFDAVVSERLAEPGDLVSAHTRVLTLTDPSSLVTEVAVSELALPRVRVGDAVSVRIDALGPRPRAARVLRIHPTLDPRTRRGMIEIALDPIPPGAAAGQFCRVRLSDSGEPTLTVPFSALRRDREGELVYRLRGGKVARTEVRSGRRRASRVEVLEGLAEGDEVVTRGFLGLHAGMRVRRVAPAAAPGG